MTGLCPVCGYPDLGQAAESCPSCGFRFGVGNDDEFSWLAWRVQWINAGMPFRATGSRAVPTNWDPRRQLDSMFAVRYPKAVGPFTCPVCGYRELSEEPRPSGGGGSYEICPSCAFQFGFTDEAEGISDAHWRAQWLAQGMPWRAVGIPRPARWDPGAQLAALLGEP